MGWQVLGLCTILCTTTNKYGRVNKAEWCGGRQGWVTTVTTVCTSYMCTEGQVELQKSRKSRYVFFTQSGHIDDTFMISASERTS